MRKKFFLFYITVSVQFLTTAAQSHFLGWATFIGTCKTGKKTSIIASALLRNTEEVKQVQGLLIQAGLTVNITKNISVTAGYGHSSNKVVISNIHGYANEHRIWEQLICNSKLKSIFMSNRFRLEQRFIPKTVIVNNKIREDGYQYANRLRYFIRNLLPLKKEPAFKKGMYAALQNEVFVNFGNTSAVNGKFFDQNRFYLATGYRLSTKSGPGNRVYEPIRKWTGQPVCQQPYFTGGGLPAPVNK